MSAGVQIVWRNPPEHLRRSIAKAAAIFPRRVDQACRASALTGEAFARMNAPWTNRTGAARGSLRGQSTVSGASGAITLSHGVHYGIYLELSNGGRFRILPQALQATEQDLAQRLTGLLADVA